MKKDINSQQLYTNNTNNTVPRETLGRQKGLPMMLEALEAKMTLDVQ